MGKTALTATALTAVSYSRVYGANERLGYGVIGTGGRGGAHLQVVNSLKEDCKVDIVAACDTYRPRMKAAAEKYSIAKQYSNHKELLADKSVDVVSIATPDHIHGYQAIDAYPGGERCLLRKTGYPLAAI